jgi:parallel beta-helix repeat protein
VHSRMFRALGAAGAVGASLAFAGPAFAATTPTLYVNGSMGNDANANGNPNTCRLSSNPCQTIQHAIGEAPTTAKISVTAGMYPEQLTITNKNLTITGAGQGSTIIDPSALNTTTNDPTHPGTTQADIVTFSGAKSGGLADLTVDGSKFTETDGGTNYVGVFMLDSAGTLNSVAVENVKHDTGSFGDQPGANGGVLVANDDQALRTVAMTGVDVTAYDKNGITCRSIGTTCNITNSAVTGSGSSVDNAQNGIELYGITGASVKGTTVSANTFGNPDSAAYTSASGILVINVGKLTLSGNTVKNNDVNIDAIEDQTGFAAGPTQGAWAITGNTVSTATNAQAAPLGAGIGDGIDLSGANAATVYSNTVTGNAEWGIALFGETNSKVGADGKANTVTGNTDDGIYVGEYAENDPSAGNSIAYNKSNTNVGDGILAAGPDGSGYQQAMNNTFGHNTLQNNDGYDAQDLSTGAKTAGTANTWTGDKCLPAHDADPGAICS